jgi:hypothetical protein
MQQSVQLNQGILAWKHAETREMVFFDMLLAGIVLALNSCRPRVEVGGVFVMGWLVSECLCLFAIPPSAETRDKRQGPSGNDMPLRAPLFY